MKETAPIGIPGYDFDTKSVARSPVTLKELRLLEEATGWTEEDEAAPHRRRKAGAASGGDGGCVACRHWPHPQLVASFLKPDGKPDEAYKAAGLET